ncbi:MAG: EAL domain-containing protein [Deltaproteobacteria bacterium]|nr:EAL domain-containing protein [Deltaproteobacteria bacterium]
MHTDRIWLDLVLPIWAAIAFLLGQTAWRVRTTAIGRGFVALAGLSASVSLLGLIGVGEIGEGEGPVVLRGLLEATASAAALRVVLLALCAPRAVSLVGEAALLLPAVGVGLLREPLASAAWLAGTQLLAAHLLDRLPRRSWQSFDSALRGLRLSFLASGLLSAAAVAVSIEPFASLVPGLCAVGLSLSLAFGLPRLGLLAQDRVQHRSVIEAMSDGVLVVDLDDRLVEVNQSARDILGIPAHALDLRPIAQVLANHPDLVELFRGAIEGQTVYSPRAVGSAEERRTYDLRLSALFDVQGAIQSRVLVLRDISDRIEIEDENRRQARHVRLVYEVSASVHDGETIDHGLEAALALIAQTMEFPLGQFLRSTETEEGNRLVASGLLYCAPELVGEMPRAEPSAGGEVGRSETHEALAQGVVEFDPRGLHWWRSLGVASTSTIPVLIGNRLYGVFELFDHPGRSVSATTGELLERLGGIVGQAVEKRLAEERVRRFAYRDDLTGLPNRQHFHQLLRAAVSLASRSERRMALLFLDLDGFKKVNDTLGHEVGDKLLAEVASRFAKVVRVSDHLGRPSEETPGPASSISRLGGDEFTVLLSEIHQPIDAALVADRLLATLEQPITLSGQDLFMATSIGIAVFPDDGADAESLIRNADAAMYFAKGRGRNSYSFYSAEMNRTQSQRLEIESRLRAALEREQFEIHYQPIRSAETGLVVAAEALVRWRDPEWGWVPPDQFIPVAEETGLIVPLGQWVFRHVCEQARRWRDECRATIRIGVNVSGKQIREPGMVEMVRQALEQTGVSPTQVELEITESTIMQDDALTTQTLRELKEMGVGLALDDFGTGYSSLSYLRRFTIDRVKIDRTFVAELPGNASDGALTSAIIAMAHGLQLDVVAEGVETEAQARFLELRGCDELQGYLYGRPCAPEEFVDWLGARPVTIEAEADPKPDDEDEQALL